MAELAAALPELAEPTPDEKAAKVWADSLDLAILGARYLVAATQGMHGQVPSPIVTLAIMAEAEIRERSRATGLPIATVRAEFLGFLDQGLRRG